MNFGLIFMKHLIHRLLKLILLLSLCSLTLPGWAQDTVFVHKQAVDSVYAQAVDSVYAQAVDSMQAQKVVYVKDKPASS